MQRIWRRAAALTLLLVAGWTGPAGAQSVDNVLIVSNANSRVSEEVALYYSRKRAVRGEQILRLNVPVAEEISRAAYQAQIEGPIMAWLAANSAQDRILYLVLAKDVPLRIAGTGGPNGTVASVDSELTLIYRKAAGQPVGQTGPLPNPYFIGTSPLADAKPFSHRTQDLYLVTRLDGYTFDDVKGLIDRGMAPSQQGIIVLDGRLELQQSPGNAALVKAAVALGKLPGWSDRTVLDTTFKVLRDQTNVLGYYSWGSNDLAIRVRHLQNQFVAGALAGEFVSTDARTFQEPSETWQVNNRPYRGSHQSLIGDLIRDGITGVAGHVAEPYLNATIRPDILFPAYASGFNLAESFYLAMPSVSWQTVVVGDPLCAPFKTTSLGAADLDPAIDPATELPKFLSERRVARLTALGAKPDAARSFARAEVRRTRHDDAGAREALEQATTADESFLVAQLLLGSLYEESEQWDAAIARYQRVIAKSPNQFSALNNLAYVLAVKKKDPAAALPLAKRAYAASKGAPAVTDTLAWTLHLTGNDAEALPLITGAAKQLPATAEVHWHAAIILAATGGADAAKRELETAVGLDAKVNEIVDVQELRKRLGTPK